MKSSRVPNFFHDRPLFGMDIGHGSLKVMQVDEAVDKTLKPGDNPRVVGYGFTTFDKVAQEDGAIIKPDIIAKAAQSLFKNHLIGDITTKRVALAIPAYRTFTRSLSLPKLKPKQ